MGWKSRLLGRLPGPIREGALRSRGWWRWARVQRPVTRVLGPRYRRSRDLIEIDITWACNLRCFNCNRSCEQAPTGEGMTLDQIERFVAESVEAGVEWRRIRVLGGEPTLHPQFLEILEVLRAYRDQHSTGTRIEVTTNGHGDKVRAAIERIPSDVCVENTMKDTVEQPFQSFNIAPGDLPAYENADFANGCAVTKVCGVGLTPYGYYPCAVAGGIDRIVGLGMARRTLPIETDDMVDQLDAFCRRCGSFKREHETPVERPVSSASWDAAYLRHRENPVRLERY
jgi:sulfatase maturation enzyme AslB (radical SAM superfamily)